MTTMTHARRWRGGGRVARSLRAAAVVTLLTATISSPAVGATPTHKTYTVGVTPSIVNGGTTQQFTVEISNTSDNHQLGSVNLTAPTGFDLTDTSQPPQGTAEIDFTNDVLKLRNLGLEPDESVAVGFGAEVPCGPGSYTWDPEGKQSNEFNGTGNDFTLDEGGSQLETTVIDCEEPYDLRFKTQPTSTVVNTPINDPDGVEVEVVDSNGQPVLLDGLEVALSVTGGSGNQSGKLVGNTTSTTVGGVATFNPVSIDHVGVQYRLTTKSGVGDATSNLFDVYDGTVDCSSEDSVKTTGDGVTLTASCPAASGSSSDSDTEMRVSHTSEGDSDSIDSDPTELSVAILRMDELGSDVERPNCGDTDEHKHGQEEEGLMFVVTTTGGAVTTTDGPDVELEFDNSEHAPHAICYRHPQSEKVVDVDALPDELRENLPPKPFLSDPTDLEGHQDDASETPWEGHLRPCTADGTPDSVDAPCEAGRQTTTDGLGLVINLRLPPGDPYCA